MIRLPLQNVQDINNSAINATGPASTAGGVANTFVLPQDCDNVAINCLTLSSYFKLKATPSSILPKEYK